MIMSEYKLTTLMHFIGERKLKQVGLLTCNTCVHILGDVLDVEIEGSSTSISQIENTMSENIIDDHTIEERTIEEPTDGRTVDEHTLDEQNLLDDSLLDPTISTEDQISLIDNDPQAIDNNMPLVEHVPSLIPVHIPEKADLHYDPLGIGYSYYPVKKIPPYTIICSECGRLYTPQFSFHSLQPIPTLLTDAQQEVLKGFYIDILL